MAELINISNLTAEYDSNTILAEAEEIVQLEAVILTKSADRPVWVDDNELEYTITAVNTDERSPDDPTDPGLPLENVIITDTIDPTIAEFVTGSLTLTIGGVAVPDPAFTIDAAGLLTVTVGSIPAGQSAVVSFRVNKI